MDKELDELDKELLIGINKKRLLKRFGIVFIELSILIISVCIFAIVVNSHSKYIFNNSILTIAYIVLILSIILLIIGILLFVKNYRIKYKLSNKAIYAYAIMLGLITVNSLLSLYLLYGPIKSFKKSLVEFSDKFEKYDDLKRYFYSDSEIEEIRKIKETN